ncbi:FAD-dependent oxidoreductase [Amycolatopsis anabasis]|uniref:FAD-dependent oxidoreductase n=1 Tax=Amycolatopsis anabasis TaxID=1840409 RepID=UPI00131D1760|nr:FAD-dependent monooxygenase [Amycolatopsis anabasis]
MTHALIIGGGIAGPVTAMALHKAGISSVVYEAYPTGADDVGAFMTIMNNGLDALDAIEAREPVVAAAFPANTVEFFSGTGKRLGDVPIGGDSVAGPHTIKRATLYRVLHDEATRRGIPVEHGKRLVDVSGKVARFEDGSQAEGDLVIGADGIHSATRPLIDTANPKPEFKGARVVCGYAPNAPVDPKPGAYRMVYGKRVFFAYTTAPDGETWWFTNLPGPELSKAELAGTTPAEWKRRIRDLLSRDRTPAAAIVDATGDEVVASNSYDLATTPTWHDDTKVIIGDAAHVAAPNAGHGASMAMEDGVTLAQCLRDLPTIPAAFATYDHLRRPRVERVVATSARMGNTATPSPLKRLLRDAILPRKLKKGPRNTATWLTHHHIDWDAKITS